MSEAPLPRAPGLGLPPLRGQKALVTGASSGIGRASAIELARQGADVVVNCLAGDDRGQEVVEEIGQYGGTAFVHCADVSNEAQVAAMFDTTLQRLGTIDILVNNAGIQNDAPFEEMTLEQWSKVITVNLTGQFLCARAAIREFLRRGVRPEVSCSAGKIVFMSSVHQVIPWAGHANYAASKGGIMMLMRSIAQEFAPRRIRINGIAPGAIRTAINTQAWSTGAAYEKLMRLVPYKRIGEPEDVARTVAWLVSDEADYVVGETIIVDGGMTLYPGFSTGG